MTRKRVAQNSQLPCRLGLMRQKFVNNQVDVWFSEQIQLNLIYQTSFDQFQVCMSLCFCTGLEIRGFPW